MRWSKKRGRGTKCKPKRRRRPSIMSIQSMEIRHCCRYDRNRNVTRRTHGRPVCRINTRVGDGHDRRSPIVSIEHRRRDAVGGRRAGRRAVLSIASDPPDRRLRRGRPDRRAGAHHRRQDERNPRPAGRDREPHRRVGQHRNAIRRARAERRLHHPDGRQQQRGQRKPVQEPRLQLCQGPGSGRAARRGADRAGRASLARGEIGQGPDRPRQGQAGRDHVRDRRQGNDDAPRGRALQSDGRRQAHRRCPTRAAARPPRICCRARSR